MAGSPERLKPDAVVEALVEVRFECDDVLDFVAPKLASFEFRKDMALTRLPPADLPPPIRRAEPNLALQPLFQLQSPDGLRMARVGERSFSWHMLAPYPGWAVVREEVGQAIEHVFRNLTNVRVVRIGLRYINVLRSDVHFVTGATSTNVRLNVCETEIMSNFNVNYRVTRENATLLVRIATPDFVDGPATDFSLMIDIDASTATDFVVNKPEDVLAWAETTHTSVKDEFVSLLKADVLKKLAVA